MSGQAELPEVLLHICCAPDATAVMERLRETYRVVGFFHNPNIHPREEFTRRLRETRRVARLLDFPLITAPYSPQGWLKRVEGLEGEPEKGRRCRVCFLFNLEAAAKEALARRIRFFTTTLTVSPHKVTRDVFWAGRGAASTIGGTFLELDFKKKDGFKRSLELSREHGLYRQNYCGCRFSIRDKGGDA